MMISAKRKKLFGGSTLLSLSLSASIIFIGSSAISGCGKSKASAEKAAARAQMDPTEVIIDSALISQLKIGEPEIHDVANSLKVAARIETDGSRIARVRIANDR